MNDTQTPETTRGRWLGLVGDRVTITGTVKVATTVEVDSYTDTGTGYYPENKMLVIVGGTGVCGGVTAKMFGTGQTLWAAARGQHVTVTGTVKGHGEHDGVKQTQVTRAKVTVDQAAPQ